MFRIILFIFIQGAFAARASDLTSYALCRQITEAQVREKSPVYKKLSLNETFKFLMDRSSTLAIGEFKNRQIIPALPIQNSRAAGSLIYSLGPEMRLSDAERELLDRAYWLSILNQRNLSRLDLTKTMESCLERARQLNMTDLFLQESARLMKAAKDIQKKMIDGMTFDVAQKVSRQFSVVNVVGAKSYKHILLDLQDLKQNLSVHLVLILHASKEGFLFDHSGYIVPEEFFEKLSALPQIKSLSIYSCYSERVAKKYSQVLEKLNLENEVRIFFPVLSGVFAGMDQTPISIFDIFMTQYTRLR